MKENWRNLWTVALGLEPGMDILSPLPAALFLYFWVLFTGFILHTFTKMVVPHPLKGYLLDFIKTMTFCTYPFGHGIMRKFFGEPGYMLAMTPVVTVTALLLREGAGNPLDVWISYLNKIIPLWKCLLKNSLQILAGFSAYHLGMLVISVEFSPEYVVILKQYYNQFCLSDLNVPIYLGLLIEFAAVVYDTWFSVQRLFKIPILDLLVKVINGGLLVVSGMSFSACWLILHDFFVVEKFFRKYDQSVKPLGSRSGPTKCRA